MNVLMISPGYPGEMPHFTRGLARVGARVIGLGDQSAHALPRDVRRALSAHISVEDLWNEGAVVEQVRHETRGVRIDRVECLWEPAMILAARLREGLGVPGLTVEQTIPFRDKEQMKVVLDHAGIRTPRHYRARTTDDCRRAAEQIGFPIIVKPIAGAGSTDTYRIDDEKTLERTLPALRHVDQVSVEEFVDGDEFTFDTIQADGQILFENVAFYQPRPIEEKKHEWVSPCSICVRNLDDPMLTDGRAMGRQVLRALDYHAGFAHMEWYRKEDGEVVFGEIGARPPGGRMVDAMNYTCDADLFTGWAEAVVHGEIRQRLDRRYNAAIVCKRAQGRGIIRRVEGLEALRAKLGPSLVAAEILPLGSPRRDWQRTSLSDGFIVVRHPELQTTLEMARMVAHDLKILAG